MSFLANIPSTMRAFYEARHEPDNMRPLAEWYWRILLTGSLLAICALLIFGSVQFFATLTKLSRGDSVQRTSPEVLSKKELADMLVSFDAREVGFEAAKRAATSIADPSR